MAERPKYCGFGGFDVSLFHRFFHHAGDGRDNHSRVPRSNRSHRQCFYKHVRVQHYDNRLCPHCARFHLLFGSQEYNVRRKHLTSRDSEHLHLRKIKMNFLISNPGGSRLLVHIPQPHPRTVLHIFSNSRIWFHFALDRSRMFYV